MLIIRRCFIFLIALFTLPSQAKSDRGPDWALQLLIYEAYLQEFHLLTQEADRLQFNASQLQLSWLGAYLATAHPLAKQKKHADHLQKLDEQRAKFSVDQQTHDAWQAKSQAELLGRLLKERNLGLDIKFQELSSRLAMSKICAFPAGLAKELQVNPTLFLQNGSPNLPPDLDLGCLAQHILLAVLDSELDSQIIQAWLDKAIKHKDIATLRLLASWTALDRSEYRASLAYLYPIVRDTPSYRYAFELIQRLYQLHEKGRGVVAIKGL